MVPLYTSSSSHNVGLSAATVHRGTPPLNPQQGNDQETRDPNKCPFVSGAWKLWSQHKLIIVSEVGQTIVRIVSWWELLSRAKGSQGQIRQRLVFSGSDWLLQEQVSFCTSINAFWNMLYDYESGYQMCTCRFIFFGMAEFQMTEINIIARMLEAFFQVQHCIKMISQTQFRLISCVSTIKLTVSRVIFVQMFCIVTRTFVKNCF